MEIPDWVKRLTGAVLYSKNLDGSLKTNGKGENVGNVVVSKNFSEIFETVEPAIYTNGGGVSIVGSSVVINSAAAAGSKHIEDSTPTEAEALQELIGFEFNLSDQIKYAVLQLSVVGLGASEVQALKLVTNGDVISDATNLQNQTGISWCLQNETIEVTAGLTNYLTRIGCIATNSAVAAAVATGAKIYCVGYK